MFRPSRNFIYTCMYVFVCVCARKVQKALKRSVTNPPSVVYLFSSSTFKDPERASLRDSGHGDSDQADSDQDTNKGSCCDMSAKEALKMKATGIKPPPLEQGASPSPLPLPNVMMMVEDVGR